jgi:hypothetical protein
VNRFGYIRAELAGRWMHSFGDVCAELAWGRVHGIGGVRRELTRCRLWCGGWRLGRDGLFGGRSVAAKLAFHRELAPVGDGKRRRFFCHGVSSIFSIS